PLPGHLRRPRRGAAGRGAPLRRRETLSPLGKIGRIRLQGFAERISLGRDAAELTALADHLTAHGLVLEMLAGPLPGIYDPSGPGKLLFAFFAAMARKGKHGGRPPVITDDMLHTVLRRRALGESVEQIQPDLI